MQMEGWLPTILRVHHTILRVTLRNKEQYAVDLSGAQYGHYQECLPWPDYLTTRVEQSLEVSAYGTAKDWLAEQAKQRGFPTDKVHSLNLSFAKELGLCIKLWKQQGESFDTLLVSPEAQYQQKKETLLGLVKELMNLSRETSIQQGSWCRK